MQVENRLELLTNYRQLKMESIKKALFLPRNTLKTMKTILILLISLTLHSCFVTTKHQDNICSLHNEKMKKTVVGVTYGAWGENEKGYENYPNAKSKKDVGCVKTHIKLAKVYYCKSCNKARREYKHKTK